jgi:hypothetical protein
MQANIRNTDVKEKKENASQTTDDRHTTHRTTDNRLNRIPASSDTIESEWDK